MNSEYLMNDVEAILDDNYPKSEFEGDYVTIDNTVKNLRGQVICDEETEITVCNKNLSNGINQNYWLNTIADTAGYTVGNSGLIIRTGNQYLTISTQTTQARYRVALLNDIPATSSISAYNGMNKDGTAESITIDCTDYKYLIINATDLTSIQVEVGSDITDFLEHQEQSYTGTNITFKTYDDLTHVYNSNEINMTVSARQRKDDE